LDVQESLLTDEKLDELEALEELEARK